MTEIKTQINYDFSPDVINRQKACLLADLSTVFNQHNGQGLLVVDTAVFLDRRQEEWFPEVVLNHQPAAIPTQINHPRYASRYSPWLIPLDINRSEDAELLALSITQALQEADPAQLITGRGRMVCGWLFSISPVSVIAQHISMTAVQELSSVQKIMLRFYDPAVNNAIWPLLDSWQRSRLLGPLTDWYLVDGDGQLLHRDNAQSARELYTFSLGLSSEEVAEITWSGPMNRALRQYRQAHRNRLRRTEPELLDVILTLLRRITKRYSFSDALDLEVCALHGLLYHPAIDLHPRIQSLLSAEEGNSTGSYVERTARLTEEEWQVLARECCHLNISTISPKNKEIL
ncbi:DUF4123 domain-containing protein [Photorhabdus antumapuensis]|uniref:DUF4123 domain-containing protein n=1 Tax=Photorhabdus antumapuensis TaxID=2862867 RepID=UPI001CEC0A5D|nr:DUF4123 domain-containing protein [Photorhabdus antumapuensis]MCA6221208.1 DUF4123 domain-containing protein [Photorhabdus antumapuensis]